MPTHRCGRAPEIQNRCSDRVNGRAQGRGLGEGEGCSILAGTSGGNVLFSFPPLSPRSKLPTVTPLKMDQYVENATAHQLPTLIAISLLLGLGKGGVPGLATVATSMTVLTAPPNVAGGLGEDMCRCISCVCICCVLALYFVFVYVVSCIELRIVEKCS
jgi:hypothetical protein